MDQPVRLSFAGRHLDVASTGSSERITGDAAARGMPIGVARSYEDIVAACRSRRQELGLPQLTIDEIAGLQSGYVGKIECGDKRLGPMSLPCLLGALGLELVMVRTVPHLEKQAARRAA